MRAQSAWKGSVQCPALQRSAAPAALPQMEQGTPQRSGASPDTPSTTSSAGPRRSRTSGVQSAHTCAYSGDAQAFSDRAPLHLAKAIVTATTQGPELQELAASCE